MIFSVTSDGGKRKPPKTFTGRSPEDRRIRIISEKQKKFRTGRLEDFRSGIFILICNYRFSRKEFFQVAFYFVGLCFQNDKSAVAVNGHKDFPLVVGL